MSQIVITIQTDNAAFEHDTPGYRPEVSRILDVLSDRFAISDPERINDINGNGVCKVEYQD